MSKIDERLNMGRPLEEMPSEPIRLETESVFDPELLKRIQEEEDDSFDDDPMNPIVKMLREYLESIKPPMASKPPKSEHKVRIYQLAAEYNQGALEAFAAEIEGFLNDGYCCHIPTVVGDFVIMDFSRRKESEEDGQQ